MHFFLTVSSIAALAAAAPTPQFPGLRPAPKPPAATGAQVVEALNFVSSQYGAVVTEIQNFSPTMEPNMVETLFHHAELTIGSLGRTIGTIRTIDTFGWADTLSLVAPLTQLDFQVHQMSLAMSSKKDAYTRRGLQPRVYNLLINASDEVKKLTDLIIEKLPMGASAAVNILSREINYTLTSLRDSYKPIFPESRPPFPTQPQQPYQPQQPQQPYQPQQPAYQPAYQPQAPPAQPQGGYQGYAPRPQENIQPSIPPAEQEAW